MNWALLGDIYHKKPQDSFDFVLKMADDSMYQTKMKMKLNKKK